MVVAIVLEAVLAGLLALLAVVLWLWHPQLRPLRQSLADLRAERDAAQALVQAQAAELSDQRAALARAEAVLETERRATQEKLALLAATGEQLAHQFKALAAEALEGNNQTFLELARANLEKFQEQAKGDLELREKAVEGLVQPIRESLQKMSTQVEELEKTRAQAYGGLSERLQALLISQQKLDSETSNLVQALRAPTVRGRWGEIQLKRVVEIAGMLEYCDFVQQASSATEDGALRPDLVVKLPGGKTVVVDAKAPLLAYLESIEAGRDDLRQERLKDHAGQIRTHIKKLSAKAYWEQFGDTPEFVVMFLPGEMFFSAALEQDPALIEEGVLQRVILATPTTLIALLRAVAYGWRQERVAASAQQISDLGSQLYERLAIMAEHFGKVGENLERATKAYNETLGSLERNVLATARKFPELGTAAKRELPLLEPVEGTVREVQARELKRRGS